MFDPNAPESDEERADNAREWTVEEVNERSRAYAASGTVSPRCDQCGGTGLTDGPCACVDCADVCSGCAGTGELADVAS